MKDGSQNWDKFLSREVRRFRTGGLSSFFPQVSALILAKFLVIWRRSLLSPIAQRGSKEPRDVYRESGYVSARVRLERRVVKDSKRVFP